MPITKLGKKYSPPKHPPIDPLKALVLERIDAHKLRAADLAQILDCSERTALNRRKGSMDDWTLGELKAFCKATGVDSAKLREAVQV